MRPAKSRPGPAGGATAATGRTTAAAGALILLGGVGPAHLDGVGPAHPGGVGSAYLDGPPPGHTGGFGEPTCARCHFDAPVNPPDARLEVRGFPRRFAPDSAYGLTVRLTATELGRAGFELAVRCRAEGEAGRPDGGAGRQAGRLAAGDGRAEVVPGGGQELRGDPAVLYARHTERGSRPADPDTAAWELAWTAPAGCPTAVLHAAANAANGDASEFGDRIVTGAWTATARDGAGSDGPGGAAPPGGGRP